MYSVKFPRFSGHPRKVSDEKLITGGAQMGEKRGTRIFDRDFKLEVVRQVIEKRRSIAEVSRSIGVHANTIHHWKKQFRDDPDGAFPGKGHLKPEEEELRRLRRENVGLKEDRAILKKALAIFGERPK